MHARQVNVRTAPESGDQAERLVSRARCYDSGDMSECTDT
jgi:hypothetical protein